MTTYARQIAAVGKGDDIKNHSDVLGSDLFSIKSRHPAQMRFM
jgi:hypothetical protein